MINKGENEKATQYINKKNFVDQDTQPSLDANSFI